VVGNAWKTAEKQRHSQPKIVYDLPQTARSEDISEKRQCGYAAIGCPNHRQQVRGAADNQIGVKARKQSTYCSAIISQLARYTDCLKVRRKLLVILLVADSHSNDRIFAGKICYEFHRCLLISVGLRATVSKVTMGCPIIAILKEKNYHAGPVCNW
jgi:hypothetical protein